ncbi:MAG: FAD-dependent pyridine nucleotide-disulfide oxidoreductase [Candidatus Solibacter sp.]|nr:FAD-dependent pyridine nucleotide-disulfide oxidoreductase [Candidatus Solibacter sp.]
MPTNELQHRVVIVGGGFGGLYAAKSLKRAPVAVSVIDRRNFHLFQPLLYQVATGALSPGEIASPLRVVLRNNRNTEVLLGEVTDLDVENRRVILRDGEAPYDDLIIATGATHFYFGHDEQWAPLAPGLKTVEDATEIRSRLLVAFERAEREHDAAKRRAWLNFVIVGGGPTGVELAGALGEIANDTLRHDFRHIDPREAHIVLVEGEPRVLPSFPPDLSAKAEQQLIALGVQARTAARVTAIDPDGVTVKTGDREERIATHTVLWAAGVRASRMGKVLAERAGAQLDKAGRVIVEPDLSVKGHPEIFVIGDLASFNHQGERQLPGVAPVAMQEGRYVANLIRDRVEGKAAPAAFHYFNKGNLATIGRNKAVAEFGKLHIAGFLAWFTWVFVHLMYLVEFDNRVLVLTEWVHNYITRNRGARLITGGKP